MALSFALHLLLVGWLVLSDRNSKAALALAPSLFLATLSAGHPAGVGPSPSPTASATTASDGKQAASAESPAQVPARRIVAGPITPPVRVAPQDAPALPAIDEGQTAVVAPQATATFDGPDATDATDVSVSPNYFQRSELSVPPRLLDEPSIELRDNAEVEEGSGKVRLRLFVSAGGGVDRAEIDSADSPSPYADAVIAAFMPLRFTPGEIDGIAVRSQVVFEIDVDQQAPGTSRASDSLGALPASPVSPSAAQK